MATIGNTPQERLVLRMEQRKSWALGVFLRTESGAAIDVSGAEITLVISNKNFDGTISPVITKVAEPIAEEAGHVRFDIQASEVNLEPGDYPTTVTFRSEEGYSLVLAKGETEVLENTEVESLNHDFIDMPSTSNLEVWLRRRNVIKMIAPVVYSKGNPGEKGDKGDPGPSIIVSDTPPSDPTAFWIDTSEEILPILDATNIPAGYVPVSDGLGGWTWTSIGAL